MNWHDQDNKKQRGNIDRVFVSPTEYYEIHHYIDHYLETNNYKVDDENRQIVRNAINSYSGSIPVKRDDLTVFLNNKFKK